MRERRFPSMTRRTVQDDRRAGGGVHSSWRRVAVTIIPLLLGALAGACTRMTPGDVAGRYELTGTGTVAVDRLDLRPDGTYLHSYAAPGSAAVSPAGRWRLVDDHEGQSVALEEYRAAFRIEPAPAAETASYFRETYFAVVKRAWGRRVRLLMEVDAPVQYERAD